MPRNPTKTTHMQGDKGRQRETKGDKTPRNTAKATRMKGDKGRQGETETRADKGRHDQGTRHRPPT